MRALTCLALVSLLVAGGCEDMNHIAATPDYTIYVAPARTGHAMVAIPPECPDWETQVNGPFDNQRTPQMGCASARNLAAMVDRPEDLLHARPDGNADPVFSSMAVQAYRLGRTKNLIDPNAKEVKTQTPVSLPGTTQ